MFPFHNAKLDALNVLEVDIDLRHINKFKPSLASNLNTADFHVEHPPWQSDIQWISPNTLTMFKAFRDLFEALHIADTVRPLLDLEQGPRLYSGFLVRRGHCSAPTFHEDWVDTYQQAFTLITPLQLGEPPAALLYRKTDGSEGRYPYKLGKGIIFGDKFVHSTEPGICAPPVELLSFTFGTDKMQYWDRISRTGAYQGNLVRRPDGSFLYHNFDA
ncbi:MULTISPECIES: hypothetical protein [Aphanothece]|uniref:hypothetical protein n=1 Tax=Aphanothece TaxID=1121 RepID=UPI003984E49B